MRAVTGTGVIVNLAALPTLFFVGLAGANADTSPREQAAAIVLTLALGAIPVGNLWLLLHSISSNGRAFVLAAIGLNGILAVWGAYYWVISIVRYGSLVLPLESLLPFSLAGISITAVAARTKL